MHTALSGAFEILETSPPAQGMSSSHCLDAEPFPLLSCAQPLPMTTKQMNVPPLKLYDCYVSLLMELLR